MRLVRTSPSKMCSRIHVTLGDETRLVNFFVRPDRQVHPVKRQLTQLCVILSDRFGLRISSVTYCNDNGEKVKIRHDRHLREVMLDAANVVRLYAVEGQKRIVVDDSDSESDDSELAGTPTKVVDLGFTRGLPLCLRKEESSSVSQSYY